jgi:hypothetical protein
MCSREKTVEHLGCKQSRDWVLLPIFSIRASFRRRIKRTMRISARNRNLQSQVTSCHKVWTIWNLKDVPSCIQSSGVTSHAHHMVSHRVTRCHVVSHGVTSCHMVSRCVTWCHVVSRCIAQLPGPRPFSKLWPLHHLDQWWPHRVLCSWGDISKLNHGHTPAFEWQSLENLKASTFASNAELSAPQQICPPGM